MNTLIPSNSQLQINGITPTEAESILKKLPSKDFFNYILDEKLKINQSYADKLINRNLNENLCNWIASYNSIKGSTWPSCNNYSDFNNLPEHIKDECVHVHNFSPEIWENEEFKDAHSSVDMSFFILLAKHSIINNIEFIKNKHVVEFSCLTGHNTATLLANGARSVIATDIRDECCNITASALQKFHIAPPHQYQILKADIYDYQLNKRICKDKDTVLLLGILYHVADHYNILQSIASEEPHHIIIETEDHIKVKDIDDPLIYYKNETTFEIYSAWENNNDTVLVGYPNRAWFINTMQLFNYKLIKSSDYVYWHTDDLKEETKHTRRVYVFECTNKTV